MRLSNKSTFSLICLILLMAFVAVPVMAHQATKTEVPGADDAAKTTAVNAHNEDPDAPSDTDVSAPHALVSSINLSSVHLTPSNTITATIKLARGVATIADDTVNTPDDTDDAAGSENEARHGTLKDSAATLVAGEITFMIGTKGENNMYTYAAVSGSAPPRVISIAATTPAGSGDTGSGAVYTVIIAVPADITDADDGQYQIHVTKADVFNPVGIRGTFSMDTRPPLVTNVALRPIGQNYANADGEWSDPFEITFNIEEPSFDKNDDGNKIADSDFKASGLDLSTIMFEVKDDGEVTTSELRFGNVQYTGSEYVVTATPVTTTSVKPKATVTVTVKASDEAGNEGVSETPLSVKLAERAATGTIIGPGDTTAPSLTSIEAPEEAEDDGTLIFTITFNEAVAVTGANAFTTDDLEVSNAESFTLTSTDNTTFKLTVTPDNPDFPVKVTIKANVMVQDTNNNVSTAISGDDTYTPEGVLGVEIAAPLAPSLDGRLVFTFTFAEEPEKSGAGAFTVGDITTSNTETLEAADLSQSLNDSKKFRLRVTPTDATKSVTVQLNADSVRHQSEGADTEDDATDDVFLVAGEIAATYTPPTPDTTAPVVTITAPAAGSVNPLMFTINFNEALSADLTVANLDINGGSSPALAMATGTLPTGVAQRYTLTVTGTPGTAVAVNLKANAVMDAAGNYAVPLANAATFTIPMPTGDITKPTFTVTTDPADNAEVMAGGTVQFTITASEALGSGNNELTEADVQGTTNVASKSFVRVSNTAYVVIVTPTDNTQPIVLTIPANSVMDTAPTPNGNAKKVITFTPADTKDPTVVITSERGTGDDAGKIIITFTFSEPIKVNSFTSEDIDRTQSNVLLAGEPMKSSTDDKVYTLKVTPPATGSATIVLKTGAVQDLKGNPLQGDQPHTYTPTPAETAATIPTTALGDTTAGGMLTVTFSKDPGTVATTATGYTISTAAGTTRTITVPADKATGSHSIALTWDNGGTGTVTYRIPGSAEPTMPANIMKVNIPANAFVVLVRANSSGVKALNFPTVPPVGGTAVNVKVWAAMPDLHDLFRRSAQSPGGALVLRKSADDAAADRPAVGTVGISEIMSGRDLGMTTSTAQAAGQWIELQNLNDKAVNVLIYAQKGSDGLISSGQLVNTAAGDNLLGNPGGMIVDAIQNIRNDGNQSAGGWNVKGKEGNSLTGLPFASMYRILPHNKSKYANADGSRYNNRKGTHVNHWAESGDVYLRGTTAATPPVLFDYRGTPGAVNNVPSISILTPAGRTGVSHAITINEVGNNANDSYDWIELKGAPGTNLRNYMISIVTTNSSDRPLIQFDNNDNAKIAANGVFLILRTDPANDPNHPIAATGYNVDLSAEAQQPGTPNSPVRYKVRTGLNLPNDGKFVLILRRPDGYHGQRSGQHGSLGVAETGNADLDKVVDVAGWDDNLAKSQYPNALSSTNVWPLYNFRDIRGFTNNSFAQNTVHQRNRVGTADGASGVGSGNNTNGQTAFGDRGWTGVGYRRDVAATAMHGGTPGYPNGALHGAGDTITGAVYISEIMYADARNGTLPQWIELRNPSNTVGADLHNWRLTIINHADKDEFNDGAWDGKAEASVLLRGLKIKPNGAVLITSRKGPRSDVHLADSEIFSLWSAHKSAFGMTNANSDVINPFGFRITLHANGHDGNRNNWQLVDDIGNLATPDPKDRRGNNERFDMPSWMLPDGNTEDGSRVSIVRKVKNKDTLEPTNGSKKWSWILSDMDSRTAVIDRVYYGHNSDTSTPGQTVGQPLPVSLSFFRPTLEDGQVVIRWTTESELDNAGFNIYRSESRYGEFKQVNDKLIQGKGTTAERSTYKWVDTSAKPGVAYYYQIEDVSFAGERQMLRTTKMKGLISAKDKLTIQWGELKEVQ